jgi:outer membrane protein TolC
MVLQSATDALKAEAELANEQYRAGTISRGERARRHLALAEALHAQANAARDRLSAREALVRALGLWGEAADIRLPDRLPDLPAERPSGQGLEELAASRRMDLAHARQQGASRQLAVDVRSQVREAHGLAQLAYDVARHQRDVAVPESRVALESAQRDYNGMLIGIFDLLAELRVAVAADTALIEALRDYWIAHSDLTAALGGEPLPNTTPASEVAP